MKSVPSTGIKIGISLIANINRGLEDLDLKAFPEGGRHAIPTGLGFPVSENMLEVVTSHGSGILNMFFPQYFHIHFGP